MKCGCLIACSYAGSVNTHQNLSQSSEPGSCFCLLKPVITVCVKDRIVCVRVCVRTHFSVTFHQCLSGFAILAHIGPLAHSFTSCSDSLLFPRPLPHFPLPHLPSGVLRGKRREASDLKCVCVCLCGFDDRKVHTHITVLTSCWHLDSHHKPKCFYLET